MGKNCPNKNGKRPRNIVIPQSKDSPKAETKTGTIPWKFYE